MRFGVDRYVLYLPMPLAALERLDGSRERRIRKKIEQFVRSPKGAIEKRPTEHVTQVKDRNVKMRAFATWCEASPFDVFIVQAIFRKRDEDEFWADLSRYSENGKEYQERIEAFSDSEAYEWLEAVGSNDEYLIVGP